MAIRSGRSGKKAAALGGTTAAGGGFARVLRRLRWPVALLWIAGIAAGWAVTPATASND